jgi:hypothetical protein
MKESSGTPTRTPTHYEIDRFEVRFAGAFRQSWGGIMVRGVIFMLALNSLWGPLARAQQTTGGTWQFAVSGDSRNYGDVVMPGIAQSALQHDVKFYWHLGDFRWMSAIDEDMQTLYANRLGLDEYKLIAWGDFLANQIAPFGLLPVYLGIGNHELYKLPNNSNSQAEGDAHNRSDFRAQFSYWLDRPEIFRDRSSDRAEAAATYYHWKTGQVEFIYLDSSSDTGFDAAQLKWLEAVLGRDKIDSGIKAMVVGMHRALPNSLACGHSMNGDPLALNAVNFQSGAEANRLSTESGRQAYGDLAKWAQETGRPVYLLASHSHFYMADIFQTEYWKNRHEVLPGWIVGTAGARRYALPPDLPRTTTAKTFVYGYLLATVNSDGKISFEFNELAETAIPPSILARYGKNFVDRCFLENRDLLSSQLAASCRDR